MFSLTKEERQVVLFLSAVALIGTGISFFSKTRGAGKIAARFEERAYKIDLNKADEWTLKSIPGIGKKLALRILTLRKETGKIADFDELKQIKGMNENRLEKLKDWVYITR